MDRVVVGLSGGVDSAVAALLLKERGYQVIGVTLRTWQAESGAYSRCCDISDARKSAMQLEIPFYNVNALPVFEEHVTRPFIDAYIHGLTPNPCVVCNRYVKWERLLEFADDVGAEFAATGHYAHIVKLPNGRYSLRQAAHTAKDQTYMLYRLSQEQLGRTMMPLSDMTKDEVREIARRAGLAVAGKQDSQEICFVLDGGYAEYIEEHIDGELPPAGDFVDEAGNIIGRHRGIINYTVGQRKGLGIALGYPAFVKEIDREHNLIVIGNEQSLMQDRIICSDLSLMSIDEIPDEGIRADVRIRYHHKGAPALVKNAKGGMAEVIFDEAVRAPAPGQSAVFYDKDKNVIGGGIISKQT